MPDYVLHVDTAYLNVSPTAVRLLAQDFFKCYLDFKQPRKFSLVPYFLCCRAIELAFKAIYLETKEKKKVRNLYNHDIEKLYFDLPSGTVNLSPEEEKLLKETSKLYSDKDFEYFNTIQHMVHGYSTFPDLNALGDLARKVTGYSG